MSKNFWVIIISFWMACIIAGSCTYFYIYYSQKQERKQFVAEFNYDNRTETQEKSVTTPTAQYDAQLFINKIQQVIETMNQYETIISTNSNDKINSNLDYLITAYQQSKFFIDQFSSIEVTNSSLLPKKEYGKIADATFNYLRASSIYYIISAKKLKNPTPFIEQQYKTAQETLATSKSHLLAVIDFHF